MNAARWSPARAYVLEAKYEFLKVLRLPAYSVPAVTFPVMFYVLFGLAFGGIRAGRVPMSTYLVATYGAFGVIGAALFGFGVAVAVERGQGWMVLKRASPMPPFALFTAKLVSCSIFSAVIVLLLSVLGVAFGGVRLPAGAWIELVAVLILGGVPFCAMGLALGCIAGPNSAPTIVNLIYLPMALVSGLWMPIEVLPSIMRAVAPFLPAYHLGQLALDAIGAGRGEPAWAHIAALTGFGAMGMGLALWGYRRDEDQTWG